LNLEQFQRAVFEVTRQPLTPSERTRPRLPDGRLVREFANAIVKPNSRMTSFERLQVYNQQYWFRLMSSISEDFPGLRRLIGDRKFEKLAVAYLNECPSQSFTLRNLGSRLEGWLRKHRPYVAGVERLAIDMVRLEWAHIEAFDLAELPRLRADDSANLGGDTIFHLQPNLSLLDLAYPVDELLLHIRGLDARSDTVSNAVLKFPRQAKVRRSSLLRPEKVYLVVYRLQGRVYFKRLMRDAFALLEALRRGEPLEKAMETTLLRSRRRVDQITTNLQEWFQEWACLGWFARQPGKSL
jgi:hypothetical protein